MFSSFAAQWHRILDSDGPVVMAFVVSLSPHFSFLLRRRDKPRLLPDKMLRSRNRPPSVIGFRNGGIPGNYGSRPNRVEQCQNLLPSRSIRSHITRLLAVWNFNNDPHFRQMRPVSVQTCPDITHVRPRWSTDGAKLLRNNPWLVRFVSNHSNQIVRDGPEYGKGRNQEHDPLESFERDWFRA